MNIKKQVLLAHTKTNCQRIVRYIGNKEKRLATLVQLFVDGPYRITQRAAWPLAYCIEQNPALAEPHMNKLLAIAAKVNASVAVKRNVMRLLQFVAVPKRYQAKAVQLCFTFLQSKTETIAVQVFAMTVLANIAKQQPALANELRVIIEDRLPYGSAGFRSRGAKVLKALAHVK